MDATAFDCARAQRAITGFIAKNVKAAGMEGAVIALSGGIDSALAAFLAVEALGAGAVRAFNMPYRTSTPTSEADARLVAETLGIAFEVIDITPQIDAYFVRFPHADRLRRANKMARERMAVIYDMSALHRAMVIGTGNRTEDLLGYTTMWGDMACGINPLGNLYKTQVRLLAEYMGVPERIITKAPSADLWEGQTDEAEMGLAYADADAVLAALYDRGETCEAVAARFGRELTDKIEVMVCRNAFKRRLPPTAPSGQADAPGEAAGR